MWKEVKLDRVFRAKIAEFIGEQPEAGAAARC
jgi:hypothetical protein